MSKDGENFLSKSSGQFGSVTLTERYRPFPGIGNKRCQLLIWIACPDLAEIFSSTNSFDNFGSVGWQNDRS